jgi:hypothetical protein
MLSLYRLDQRLHAKNLPRELVPLVQAVNASLDRLGRLSLDTNAARGARFVMEFSEPM